MKRSFFQAAVVSILLYGCTTWTLTKRLEKKLDGNYTSNIEQVPGDTTPHETPTIRPLAFHQEKILQVRRTWHAGHCWRSKGRARKWCTPMGPSHMAKQKQDDQPELTYSSYVMTQDRNPEDLPGAMNDREKWRKMVSGYPCWRARHDDDDDDEY